MPAPNSCPTLLEGWSFNISLCWYLMICAVLAIMVRFVHCIIKAYIAGDGRHGVVLATMPFLKRFKIALCGFSKIALADYWLGTFIGFAEITFYPVLIFTNYLSVIGGWLAIKTAGNFVVWREDQVAFNRFLTTNLVNLAIAYFLTFLLERKDDASKIFPSDTISVVALICLIVVTIIIMIWFLKIHLELTSDKLINDFYNPIIEKLTEDKEQTKSKLEEEKNKLQKTDELEKKLEDYEKALTEVQAAKNSLLIASTTIRKLLSHVKS